MRDKESVGYEKNPLFKKVTFEMNQYKLRRERKRKVLKKTEKN